MEKQAWIVILSHPYPANIPFYVQHYQNSAKLINIYDLNTLPNVYFVKFTSQTYILIEIFYNTPAPSAAQTAREPRVRPAVRYARLPAYDSTISTVTPQRNARPSQTRSKCASNRAKSASTISAIICSSVISDVQPSVFIAFAGLPSKTSTSAGR